MPQCCPSLCKPKPPCTMLPSQTAAPPCPQPNTATMSAPSIAPFGVWSAFCQSIAVLWPFEQGALLHPPVDVSPSRCRTLTISLLGAHAPRCRACQPVNCPLALILLLSDTQNP